MISRGYVALPHGRVHFRHAGRGPAVVLLHDSPRSSVMHEALIAALASRFAVYALDTPGYGLSTALPADPAPTIPDFARALGATLDALGLERVLLYGFHTSSKIALELARQQPARIALAVLDGLSLPSTPTDPSFIARYMKPFEPTADGGYLASQWTKVRDFHRFFPWFAQTPAARLDMEGPPVSHLHVYCLDTLHAGESWSSAYSAAMRYSALPAVATLQAPVIFTCRADDVLYGYLDALPSPLPDGTRIERLSGDPGQWRDSLIRWFTDAAARASRGEPQQGWAHGRAFVSAAGLQWHVQRHGAAARRDVPPLVVLHDLPGSAAAMQSPAMALATDRVVYVVDLPGNGDTTPLQDATVAAAASALSSLLGELGHPCCDVLAEGLSGNLALRWAADSPQQVAHVVLDGLSAPATSVAAEWQSRWWQPIAPSMDGSHLLAVWHRLRDRELHWPWFDTSRAAIRRREARLDADWLHRVATDVLNQLDHAGELAVAALGAPTLQMATTVSTPTLVLASPGDPRYADAAAIATTMPKGQLQQRPASDPAFAAAIAAFLDA